MLFTSMLGALEGQSLPTGHRSCHRRLPIEAVSASRNRPFGTHDQTIEDDSTEPVSQ